MPSHSRLRQRVWNMVTYLIERHMNLSMQEDFYDGAVYGVISLFAIKWWFLLVSPICGILWMLGGIGWLGWNGWRRIVMPATLCLLFLIVNHSGWPLVSFGLQYGALSLGYSTADANQTKVSWLGSKFGKWARLAWVCILIIAMIPMFI